MMPEIAMPALVDFAHIQFWQRESGQLALLILLALLSVLFAWHLLQRRHVGRNGIVLPALLGRRQRSAAAWLRFAPMVPFAAGMPFAILALADPYTALVSETVSFPGRRIALMIDASTSMTTTFHTETLATLSKSGPVFFSTVAAAERFVRLRQQGKYHDLVALVEFGDQAYVITPFTTDYDNVLLSIALIKDPVEFSRFPNRGTVIARALEQSLELFRAFSFLEAAGNVMVIFTDGEDTTASTGGKRLDDILASAVRFGVPLYFVRTNYDKRFGDNIPDQAWTEAVERTGGRFYAVSNESDLLRAIADIDRVAGGAIQIKQYSSQEPRFAFFAITAAALWTLGAALKLALPAFRQFP
jgi:hypothetical protein